MEKYTARDSFIPPQTKINDIEHSPAVWAIDSLNDLSRLPYYMKKAGKILLDKNIRFVVESYIGGNNIPFVNLSSVSKDNCSMIKKIKKHNAWVFRNPFSKRDIAYLDVMDHPKYTVEDMNTFFVDIANHLDVQEFTYHESGACIEQFIFRVKMGMYNDLPVNNIFDWKSGITFYNQDDFNRYCTGKSVRQKKEEFVFQENLKNTGLLDFAKEISRQTFKKENLSGNSRLQYLNLEEQYNNLILPEEGTLEGKKLISLR